MARSQTPEQRFKRLFDSSNDESTAQEERASAQRRSQDWLKRYGKKPIDISSILAQAERGDASCHSAASTAVVDAPAQLRKHALESRRRASHLQILGDEPDVRTVYTLRVLATNVYDQFQITPRVLLISEGPESGKTTALEIARRLMFRANDGFASDAAIRDHFNEGRGSGIFDEVDLLNPAVRQALLALWNRGHLKSAKIALMIGGRRKQFNLFAPAIAAGLGAVLGQAQLSRHLFSG